MAERMTDTGAITATGGEQAGTRGGARLKARIATWHRWLGLILTIPLLGWIMSSAAMMLITMNAPNGLAGVYTLRAFNSVDVPLTSAGFGPDSALRLAAGHGVDRAYWVRLQSRGPELWYVVKPSPYAAALVFDARTGQRLDPLSDKRLTMAANEALEGGRVERVEAATEYNRYYTADRVPAVRAFLGGAQPATLILSRDEGRTLRRLNNESGQFEWWYRTFHVNQFTDHLALWTALLYLAAVGVIALSAFGYQLFWWRRGRRIAAAAPSLLRRVVPMLPQTRDLHRKVGVVVGGLLIVQLTIGIYLWLCLGPLEDPFRGKATFNRDWQGGIAIQDAAALSAPSAVLSKVAAQLPASPRPAQAVEWRRFGGQEYWYVSTRRDEPARMFAAATGTPLRALPLDVAADVAREEVAGRPRFQYLGEAPQLWMDLNRPVPTYRLRFEDPFRSDIYVAQTTGEIIQRRPYFWRLFEPFLNTHMFAFTGNKTLDMVLLFVVQSGVLLVILTGWRLQFPGRSAADSVSTASTAAPAHPVPR